MTTAITPKEPHICASREIAMRRRVYPKFVGSGRMKQPDADREIALMEAIVALLQERLPPPAQGSLLSDAP